MVTLAASMLRVMTQRPLVLVHVVGSSVVTSTKNPMKSSATRDQMRDMEYCSSNENPGSPSKSMGIAWRRGLATEFQDVREMLKPSKSRKMTLGHPGRLWWMGTPASMRFKKENPKGF